jgi:pentatricopeptide repeat protein
MQRPNETTSQKADGESGLPAHTGEENRRLTSASNNEPGRKSKRDKSIPKRRRPSGGEGAKKTKRREKRRHRELIAQYLGAKRTHSESTSIPLHGDCSASLSLATVRDRGNRGLWSSRAAVEDGGVWWS